MHFLLNSVHKKRRRENSMQNLFFFWFTQFLLPWIRWVCLCVCLVLQIGFISWIAINLHVCANSSGTDIFGWKTVCWREIRERVFTDKKKGQLLAFKAFSNQKFIESPISRNRSEIRYFQKTLINPTTHKRRHTRTPHQR